MIKKVGIQIPGRNFKPHPTQMEFLVSDAETKILMAGRRWGKTRAAVAQPLTSRLRIVLSRLRR